MLTTQERRKILAQNEASAAELAHRFAESGTLVVDLISGPGSGKTALLEDTARRLGKELRLACVVGDIATERDADRLRAAGLSARQISTGGACHLDARMVKSALDAADFGPLDILFVENVGNLVCPASYALGEDFKTVLLSVAEGHDKPLKYPGIFSRAAVAVITKSDLLPYVRFDLDAVRAEIALLRHDVEIVTTSTFTGQGMDSWCALLRNKLAAKRAATVQA
jgi:hydrogenase nickel incorporation protein HypB